VAGTTAALSTQTAAEPAGNIQENLMKVNTNLKSGNLLEDALQATSNLGDQVGRFFSTAERQAEDLTSTVANTASALWQDFTGWIGL